MKSKVLTAFVFAARAAAPAARGEDAQAQPKQKPPDCTAAEFRQFDFWIGDWNVTDPKGEKQGENRIERVEAGCALQENWAGGAMTGRSLNAWDRSKKRWMQTWVSSTGGVLELSGGLDAGKMVMTGERTEKGTLVKHRITWEKLNDGRVRQVWSSSSDGGTKWQTLFEGLYAKK